MTETLKPCRKAFENWFFPYREECWNNNILLDDNDANSMWLGWEAGWNNRHAQSVDVERLRGAIQEAELSVFRDEREQKAHHIVLKAAKAYLNTVAPEDAERALDRLSSLIDKVVGSEAMYFGCAEHQDCKDELKTIRKALKGG